MTLSIPEEAVVDAVSSDSLVAASLLVSLANRETLPMRDGAIDDFAREHNISLQKLSSIIHAMTSAGLLTAPNGGIGLAVSKSEGLLHAAVLRGVAYAKYRQRDSNEIDITLSPPAHPSRLMEILPKQGFAWTRLYDTKDSLVELASQAQERLIIVSPFLDREGLQWIEHLFDSTNGKSMDRILIVRGRDRLEKEVLRNEQPRLSCLGIKVLSYAIAHDPALRSPAVETFHAKILLADNNKAYIGSANMTRWSRDFSMECGVILKGPSVKPVATLVDAIMKVSNPWRETDSANSCPA